MNRAQPQRRQLARPVGAERRKAAPDSAPPPRANGAPPLDDFELERHIFFWLTEVLGRRNRLLAPALKPFGLRVPEWRDDIDLAREALQRLIHGARTLVFFGTGGSSLGGQTLAQLGGWGIPGDDKHGSEARPRTRFYDNLDARTVDLALSGLDLKTTRFVVISKSGGTPETLVQATTAIEAVRKGGLTQRIPDMFLAVTEPKAPGATNGLRAMPHGGALCVSALHADEAGGRVATLQVEDEGVGIPPEDVDSIFQPFRGSFGKGTGLGLAIVHRIVTDYGGHIDVKPRPGGGTMFRVVFREAHAQPERQAS